MNQEQEPYCDFRMTVRVEIPNEPGQFARLATLFADADANEVTPFLRSRGSRGFPSPSCTDSLSARSMYRLNSSKDFLSDLDLESFPSRPPMGSAGAGIPGLAGEGPFAASRALS